ncbi:kielin/chordin-like protein [Saccostrea cucullata]|uniref:kielin/chordin-like protein n=1 Tax=Saccostrea cuccullata TaxID=36930 RepID=UPI002ED3258C
MQKLLILFFFLCLIYTADSCMDCRRNGVSYRSNSDFSFDEGCYRFNCQCNCDGSWNCPSFRTQNICRNPSVSNRCQKCQRKGVEYPGNSDFSFDEGCYRFNCQCNCDGSWDCPSTRTQNICRRPQVPDRSCPGCTVKGRNYPAGQFYYDDVCLRIFCECDCNGSYKCSSDMNIC